MQNIPDTFDAEVRHKTAEEMTNAIHGITILISKTTVCYIFGWLLLFSLCNWANKRERRGACDCWKVSSVTDWIQIFPLPCFVQPKGKTKKKEKPAQVVFSSSSSSFISLFFFSFFFTSLNQHNPRSFISKVLHGPAANTIYWKR